MPKGFRHFMNRSGGQPGLSNSESSANRGENREEPHWVAHDNSLSVRKLVGKGFAFGQEPHTSYLEFNCKWNQ
jgi:hypothetical protein